MKPRCQGHHDRGAHTSFVCVLDEGHGGFCKPYVPPTVDEWRACLSMRAAMRAAALAATEQAEKYIEAVDEMQRSFERREHESRAEVARLQTELAASEADARFYAGRTARIEEACRADAARLQAENDALRAIIESGKAAS